jgi:hypothetical protein
MGQTCGGGSTSSHVPFASIAVISSSMAWRQHSCSSASANVDGSASLASSRCSSSYLCARPDVDEGPSTLSSRRNRSGASSWSASRSASPSGGDVNSTAPPAACAGVVGDACPAPRVAGEADGTGDVEGELAAGADVVVVVEITVPGCSCSPDSTSIRNSSSASPSSPLQLQQGRPWARAGCATE